MEIKFKRDTSFRKQFFVPDSFAHPAKMDAQLLIWIVEKYSKVGEVIFDPMAGSGTTMLACGLGRDVILVELEEKFCKMMRNNWGEVRMRPQLGYQMGNCQIIQGDARQLETCLGGKVKFSNPMPFGQDNLIMNRANPKQVDKIVTSPPYAEALDRDEHKHPGGRVADMLSRSYLKSSHGRSEGQIGNLPYGQIDKIVTSPPFAGNKGGLKSAEGFKYGDDELGKRMMGGIKGGTGDSPDNIDALPYGNIDSIITSPPYSDISHSQGDSPMQRDIIAKKKTWAGQEYSADKENIGNLKSQAYLEAMLQVYQQCWGVLRNRGLMILVTKNFIRNKQVIRLDLDTIKLCEQAGFKFLERHNRKLPSQSFWRVIYHQKHPEVEQIKFEDVLVFRRYVS